MNSENNFILNQRVMQLQIAIQHAESEMLVALLSFSLLASYACELDLRLSLKNLINYHLEHLQ